MAWTYDPTDISTETPVGRRNAVRLLFGDTDTSDQQVQDEEIDFSLSQTGDNVYYAASWSAYVVAAKYSRLVTTDLDGALSAEYSDLSEKYYKLSSSLKSQGQRFGGTSTMGIGYGGIKVTDIESARGNDNRVQSSFTRDRFRFEHPEYRRDDWLEE